MNGVTGHGVGGKRIMSPRPVGLQYVQSQAALQSKFKESGLHSKFIYSLGCIARLCMKKITKTHTHTHTHTKNEWDK
jgi:hypothetical protein